VAQASRSRDCVCSPVPSGRFGDRVCTKICCRACVLFARGLAIALVLWGGPKYWPLVLFCELLGALFNYHRALFSWCGIPGVIGVYIFYAAGLSVVRRCWPVDIALGTVTDVGRITFIFLSSAAPTAVVGALTLLGDGIIARTAFTKTAINWWESDAISILTFTPMLLLYVVPALDVWMTHAASGKEQPRTESHWWPTANKTSEMAAEAAAIAAALWLVFRFPPAIPYQPLYVLFIPVIWISVRHGLQGASLATFTVNCGAMFLADANHSEVVGLPRLQLAMLTLALTGLCVGAVVTERRRVEKALARSEFSLSRAQSVAREWEAGISISTPTNCFGRRRPTGFFRFQWEHPWPSHRSEKCFIQRINKRFKVAGMRPWPRARMTLSIGSKSEG
jgi:two-component system, LuxR family, sensor kinase FixL